MSGASAEVSPEGPVLVVGGAGYIGSHTARMLAARGVEAIVFDNLSTGYRELVRGALVEADLADAEALAAAFAEHRPRSVIHFAARISVGESVHDPALYYRENVVNTFHLLEAMRSAGCRDIVFSSSAATYGMPEEVPIPETHSQLPVSPYGRTKLHMEHMLFDYAAAFDLRVAALRYFNAAGASEDGSLGELHVPETHLIPLLFQVALGQRDEIEVFGDDYATPDGTCIRDYVHVEDLAEAHLLALARLQAGEKQLACNLGTGSGYSVEQVLACARKITGHPIPARISPRRSGDPPELVSDGTRAREQLGWEPTRSGLERILGDAWRFHQRVPDGYGGGS